LKLLFTLVVALAIIGTLLPTFLFWMGVCSDSASRTYPGWSCGASDDCLEFISTYLLKCKYKTDGAEALVAVMLYCSALTMVCLHHIAMSGKKGSGVDYLSHASLVIGNVGLCLVFQYDSMNLTGTYGEGADLRTFAGYDTDPAIWHKTGVLLFFSASAVLHAIIISRYSVRGAVSRAYDDFQADLALETSTELIYLCCIGVFFVFFLLDRVVPAVAFEYIVVFLYASLLVLATTCYLHYTD